MKCPCIECLKLPICRMKRYMQTVVGCKDIHDYLEIGRYSKNHAARIQIFESTIRPIKWELGKNLGLDFRINKKGKS